jgi:competence protein ComEA
MIATRPHHLAAFLCLALLGPASTSLAQATKPRVNPPPANSKAAVPAREPVDLNSASAADLATLPGIGDAFAHRIIEGRPHRAVADLAQAGIPATTVDKLGPMVVVRPLPPAVDINEDPAEKLQTLPGVGPVLAREIIAGRPYSKYDDLARLKGIGPARLDDLRGRLKFGRPGADTRARPKKAAEVDTAPRGPAETRAPVVAAREKTGRTAAPTADDSRLPAGAKVNINSASKEQLDRLPGIGPARAQAILEARPFATIEDIMKVKGIKEVEFGKIKDMISVK